MTVKSHLCRAGVSKRFCKRATQAITQQFEGRTSYVTRLFRDMLHSTKATDFSLIYFFIIDEMSSRWYEMALRAGFGPSAVVWRRLIQSLNVFINYLAGKKKISLVK